ncbi:MAG TPA: RDD family protein [Myxococcota bacterium]|nr:RDD family protein [Myxococcota bacterium]
MSTDPGSPYAPPSSEVRSVGPLDGNMLATTGQRFATYLIDSLTLFVLQTAVVALVARSLSPVGVFLISNLAFVGYYVVMESRLGWTLGKQLVGTRVVREDGGTPRTTQILGRTLARIIPFEPFSALFGQGHPRPWHDTLSGTRVIRMR